MDIVQYTFSLYNVLRPQLYNNKALLNVHYKVYMYIIQCTIYIVHCSMYKGHCTIYIVTVTYKLYTKFFKNAGLKIYI